jgi:Holliday junction resolvasome RuvABC endonuclease subunit
MFTILSLDISLSRTGYCVFNKNGELIETGSIPTNDKAGLQQRLKVIGDFFIEIKHKFSPKVVVMEQCFTRFNKATQILYRVHGVLNYLFSDCEQVYYTTQSIKKRVLGKGNATKEDVWKHVMGLGYVDIFKNFDETDSFVAGVCYLKERGVIE